MSSPVRGVIWRIAAPTALSPSHLWRRRSSTPKDPEQAVDRDQSEPTRPLATKNVQLVTEGEVLHFQNHPTTESAGNNRDDGTHELEHAGNTTATHPETLDFSLRSEFLVATGPMALTMDDPDFFLEASLPSIAMSISSSMNHSQSDTPAAMTGLLLSAFAAPFESTKLLEAEDLVVPTENLIVYERRGLLKEPVSVPGLRFFCGRYQARFQCHR
jgi:hypothetical protein